MGRHYMHTHAPSRPTVQSIRGTTRLLEMPGTTRARSRAEHWEECYAADMDQLDALLDRLKAAQHALIDQAAHWRCCRPTGRCGRLPIWRTRSQRSSLAARTQGATRGR